MNSLLTLSNADLDWLTPDRAVRFFQELLWAECRRIGLPVTAANISSDINVRDGGVDASITRASSEPASDLVQDGFTAFQIKTGTSFMPWRASAARRELLGSRPPSKENLGENVRRCLDRGGRYVLVCFGIDPADPRPAEAVAELKRVFAQCGYEDPHVALWIQNTLIGLCQQFPSIVLGNKCDYLGPLQTHASWSINGEMQRQLEKSSDYDTKCEDIRRLLRTDDHARHLRVIEEAGSGKTRFALEATRAADVAPLVLYADSPRACDSIVNTLCLDDDDRNLILVVDECEQAQSIRLWDRLKHRGARIKLITIHNLQEFVPPGVERAALPALGPNEIKAILRQYVAPAVDVNRWAVLAGSSPRFAHMIGSNLRLHPEDPLRPTDRIFDRIVGGGDPPESDIVRRRRFVLRHLALFSRFGFREPVAAEGHVIAELAMANDDISNAQFRECVKWFQDQKVLQGDRTLYITPKALHVQMWREYWDNYGDGFEVEAFLNKLQGNHEALGWFFEMFKYAAHSRAAARVVHRLLGPGGMFENSPIIRTELGARFFLALTEANAAQALACLKRTVGTWSREELLQFADGRQWIVWALERTAVWQELFADSARLLLALGEEENATNANNASGMFADLFSLATGRAAPTEAEPADRLPVLVEALDSTSKNRRMLALQACRTALQRHAGGRFIGAEYQGLRREPQLWTPETYGQLAQAIRSVWELLVGRMESLHEDEQREALKILYDSAPELNFMESLARMVVATFKTLADKPYVVRRGLLEVSLEIRRRFLEGAPDDVKVEWDSLCEDLTGHGFAANLRRYIGMSVFEDEYDEHGNRTDELDRRIASLAVESLRDTARLEPELNWLSTEQADNAFRFGYHLGKGDAERSLLPKLLAAQREPNENRTTALLGGYLRAVFEHDQEAREAVLGEIERDAELRQFLVELVWRSGMTEHAGRRILAALEAGTVSPMNLRIFAFGRYIDAISEDLFDAWIGWLLSNGTADAARVALELFSGYYRGERAEQLPKLRARELLMHRAFFGSDATVGRETMQLYHWEELAKAFVTRFPGHSSDLAREILAHFHEEGTVASHRHSPGVRVLDAIVKQDPDVGWNLVAERIRIPMDERTFQIREWLRGTNGGGGVWLLSPESLLRWVAEDVDNRAWFLSRIVPKVFSQGSGPGSLARELLVRYGTREDVRSNLHANWMTDMWWGSEANHHRGKKRELEEIRKSEPNQNVRDWIDTAIQRLDRMIEEASVREERETY